MQLLFTRLIPFLALALWVGLWSLGGIWAVRSAFNLRRNEETLVGLAFGLVLVTLMANLLGRWVVMPLAFWLSAGVVLLLGVALLLPRGWRAMFPLHLLPSQLLALAALAWVFARIAEGYAIFDDFAHLPTTSLIATGELPPRFALDPSISYGYHHFLMVFAAGLMRIADIFPWRALDLSRGLTFALAALLMFVWVQRITRSHLAGLAGVLFMAFAGGTRWLLLLLPTGLLERVSQQVSLLGSGLQSGPNLAAALVNGWAMEGGGPLEFPFAFANGMLNPGVLSLLSVNGLVGVASSLSVLLTLSRWKNWRGPLLTALLLSANGLLGEIGVLRSLAAWGVLAIAVIITRRSWRLPRGLLVWLVVVLAGQMLGLLNGGAIGDALSGLVSETVTGAEAGSYQTLGLALAWPPVMVSSHLGVLSLVNPYQLLVLLAEMGPLILVLPLLVVFGWKAFRAGRWYETVLVISALGSILSIFLVFSGSTGVRNTARFYGFLGTARLFAVPLVWLWAARRSAQLKTAAAGLGLATLLGGVALFAVMLPALQRPVYSSFIGDLDAQATRDYWNRLEPDALVFDSLPYRAPTILARYTRSSTTWYAQRPDWLALVAHPDPVALHGAGYDYAYLDRDYVEGLSSTDQDRLRNTCAQVMREYSDWTQDYRLLLDLRGCN